MRVRPKGEAVLRELTADEVAALEERGWTIGRTFNASAPEGTPAEWYVLTRANGRVDLALPTFEGDLEALLSEPLPATPAPVQTRVAEALQALQTQPTISGADLAAVIAALTGQGQ